MEPTNAPLSNRPKKVLAQLHVVLIDNGTQRPDVQINGNLADTIGCLYMLEVAKDLIKNFDPKKKIAIAENIKGLPPMNGGQK